MLPQPSERVLSNYENAGKFIQAYPVLSELSAGDPLYLTGLHWPYDALDCKVGTEVSVVAVDLRHNRVKVMLPDGDIVVGASCDFWTPAGEVSRSTEAHVRELQNLLGECALHVPEELQSRIRNLLTPADAARRVSKCR